MRHQDTIRARFSPNTIDDLKPEAKWWVGREATWRAMWVVDDGPYKGDWAMMPDRESNLAAGENMLGWVPLCDLEPIAAPAMFAIGSTKWPGLSKITEEAGEVQQVIGKLMGTGGYIRHWDGTNLRERLIEEIGDVLAACDFAVEVNELDVSNEVRVRREKKLALFRKWHKDAVESRK